MTQEPEVSVVMCVYNSADTLEATIESVLSQEDVNFEFIVVNDGSTDATENLLDKAASRESRLRVIHQENMGLTRSLVRGCKAARGEFIARQDAGGDVSLAGRLKIQRDKLRRTPEATLISSAARFVGPRGELLYEVVPEASDLTSQLQRLEVDSVRGPAHHGTTMFRQADYSAVGGYRPEFAVAQDLDLWLRLVERGVHIGVSETLYEARVTPDSISGMYRHRQIRATEVALECARRRRGGKSDNDLLARASRVTSATSYSNRRLARSQALYFIARCLHERQPDDARKYYREAVREFPLNPKPWFFLLAHLTRPE